MKRKGEGDSVKEIAEFWKDASIEGIHRRVVAGKIARFDNVEKQAPKNLSRRHSATSTHFGGKALPPSDAESTELR